MYTTSLNLAAEPAIDPFAGEYWIVNQILSKGLHNADQESLIYTTTLMDKLEQACGHSNHSGDQPNGMIVQSPKRTRTRRHGRFGGQGVRGTIRTGDV